MEGCYLGPSHRDNRVVRRGECCYSRGTEASFTEIMTFDMTIKDYC